ncbi:MAG: small multi-drug export protein [Lachnospiraceae bacterium]|nr:small multi-drug export protein [Lachnospiraceae bacterium]
MTESVLNWFMNLLSGMPNQLIVFIVSMVPLIELRGGLIAAALLGMPIGEAVLYCLAGNIVPVPFILLFITPIFAWLKKTKLFRPLVEKMEAQSLGKSDRIRKYEFWGLVLFVGIPLPGTGAWTGALIASLLEIRLKKAVPAIFLGLLLATAIMCIITYGIPALVKLF